MRFLNIFLIYCFLIPFAATCQSRPSTIQQVPEVKKSIHTTKHWNEFLAKFPIKKIQFLDSLQYYQHLKDTISIDLVNAFFWSDSIPSKAARIDGKKYNVIEVAPSIYKGYEFAFPCCGNQEKGILMHQGKNKNGEPCDYYGKVYPLAKIDLPNDRIMVLYSYISAGDVFYQVTVEIINKHFEKTGHWGFLYGAQWNHCDDTIYEMGRDHTPYSYPVNITENGFDVIDNVIENEYNEEILQTFWKVIINEKGQFEIVREKKIYEDKIELWSKRGYRIQDTDGFTNLRAKPTTSGKVISKLTNGTLVTIIDASKDWWLIKTAAHQKGFIHKSRIVEGQ